jgi:hypothetical protein
MVLLKKESYVIFVTLHLSPGRGEEREEPLVLSNTDLYAIVVA